MTAHRSTPTVPTISDPAKRILRTLIQVGIPAFLTVAASLSGLLTQVGVVLSPRAQAIVVGIAAAITSTATLLSWAMQNPIVNGLLERVGLAGTSTVVAPADTETRAIQLAYSSAPAGN